MRRREVALDLEPLVLWIEDVSLPVVARERLDRVERVSEREHHELGAFGDVAAQHPDAAVPGRTRVARDAGRLRRNDLA